MWAVDCMVFQLDDSDKLKKHIFNVPYSTLYYITYERMSNKGQFQMNSFVFPKSLFITCMWQLYWSALRIATRNV